MPRLMLPVQVLTCRTCDRKGQRERSSLGKAALTRTQSSGGEGKSFAFEDRKNLLSIYSCARPCAKAPDALVHLILVTPIIGMEMKKS